MDLATLKKKYIQDGRDFNFIETLVVDYVERVEEAMIIIAGRFNNYSKDQQLMLAQGFVKEDFMQEQMNNE